MSAKKANGKTASGAQIDENLAGEAKAGYDVEETLARRGERDHEASASATSKTQDE